MNKLLKKTKKGFTLVELLVVIAILAVLASVSVVGYLGFTTKARNSNAMTELAQVREVLRAELIDGDTNYYSLSVNTTTTTKVDSASEVTKAAYEATTNPTVTKGFTIQYNSTATATTLTFGGKGSYTVSWDSLLKAAFTDLASLGGEIQVTVSSSATTNIESIQYYSSNGGKAKWTVNGDVLVNGDSVADKATTNTISKTA